MAASPSLRFLSLTLPMLLAASACQREPIEYTPDELQALLDDGELDLPDTPITRAQIAADGGTAGAGGSGGGTGGSGGSSVDGGTTDVAADRPGGRGGSGAGGAAGSGMGTGGSGGRGGVGGSVPGGRGGSVGPDGGFPEPLTNPVGMWNFDDCNEFRTNLEDTSFNGHTGFRTVRAACVPGIEGQGVSLPGAQDLVYVPDQPAFTFERGVTVAAWVNPTSVKGLRTIFRKRDGLTSAMALMIVDKNFVFVVSRQRALPVAITAPAKAGVFTHVAATYDGNQLQLYLNGEKVAGGTARGTIENGEGPLLLGNDGFTRRFEGTIDKVWFATEAATPETIASLQCLRRPPTMSFIPAASDPVSPGTTVVPELAITNNNHPACSPEFFNVFSERIPEGFQVQPSFSFVNVPSGETVRTPISITSPFEAEPGPFEIGFLAFGGMSRDEPPRASFTYNVANDGRCRVITSKELMIRAVSVVDDPVRTGFTAPAGDARRGVWTFKHLMEQLAPTPEQAPAVAEAVFRSFTEPQTINGFRVEVREGMQPLILDPWPRDASGQLDLARTPVRLLAIVNRVDLRNVALGHAGEGRFVFGLLGPGDRPLEGTVIFEYFLPASTEAQVQGWINDWHALGALPFPSEEYNAALQALTDRFTSRGAMPSRPNGSALAQFRTNEIDLGSPFFIWELREFTFGAGGMLVPDTIKLTPDRPSFDRTPLLASFINANEESIVLERHDIPRTILDPDTGTERPFVAGAVFNDLSSWNAPGITNPEARHKFSLNTCNGCHSSQETNTPFLMVSPRVPGQEARLSPFLTGTTTFDPAVGPRVLNDLRRRNMDMHQFACPGEPFPQPPPPPDAGPPFPGMRPDAGGPAVDARPTMPPPPPPTGPPPPMGGPGTGGIPAERKPVPARAQALDPSMQISPSLSRGIGRVH